MSASVGRVDLDLGINQKGLKQQIKGIGNSNKKEFQALGKSLGASLGHTFSVAIGNMMANLAQTAIQSLGGGFFKSSVELGSSIAELENVTSKVFPNMTSQLENFSKTAIQQYGLTELQAKKMVGTFGSMSQAFGYSEEAAYDMSTSLTGLVGDVASFYNLDHDVAYTKIKSVFTGETESLKELGIVMTQTALDEFAMRQGMGKTVQQMTEQEKVALRLAFVTDKLTFAAGDFNKTQNQWANQTRILAGQWDSFKAVIGQGFIAVLTPLIQRLNTLMATVIKVGEKFREFIATVTGQDISVSSSGAVIQEVAEVTTSAADAADTAAGKASSAAKEVKKSLMGFDKLNKLAEPNKDSGSSSGGGGGFSPSGGSSTVSVTPVVGEIDEKSFLGKIASYIKGIDFGPLKDSFSNLKDSIVPVLETVGNSVKWFMDEILAPLGQWVIEDALPAFFNLLAGALDFLNPILTAFQGLAEWLWDSFLGPIASWTGGVIVSVLEGVGSALSTIGAWMSENQSVVNAMVTSLTIFFGLWKLTELMAFIQMSGGLVGAFTTITTAIKGLTIAKIKDKLETMALTAMYAKDFVASLAKGTAALAKQSAKWVVLTAKKVADKVATLAHTVAETAATAAKWLATTATTALGVATSVLTSPITLVIAAIAALVAGVILLIKNWDAVKAAAVKCWEGIKNAVKAVVDWLKGVVDKIIGFVKDNWQGLLLLLVNPFAGAFKLIYDNCEGFRETINNLVEKIKEFFTGLWDSITSGARAAWDGIKSAFSSVATFFKDIFTKAWDGVKKVFSTGGKIFDGIKDGIVSAFKTVVNAIIKGINKVVALPFKGLNGILDTLSALEIAGIKPFSWLTWRAPIPQLPLLAEGGFVRANQPQPVIIGDNKRHGEIVAPEDKLYEIVSKALQAFMGQLIIALNSSNSNSQRANEMMQLIIQLGEETIVNRVIKMINAESKRQGSAVIKI